MFSSVLIGKCLFFNLQDLQAEIETHQHAFDSLQSQGKQMAQAADGSGTKPVLAADSSTLQRRLEEMNQRWVRLKTKSMEIRQVHSPGLTFRTPYFKHVI